MSILWCSAYLVVAVLAIYSAVRWLAMDSEKAIFFGLLWLPIVMLSPVFLLIAGLFYTTDLAEKHRNLPRKK